MSTFRVKSIWTAFITAFFALLASLGLMSSPAAAVKPASTTQAHTGAATATANIPSMRGSLPRDRSHHEAAHPGRGPRLLTGRQASVGRDDGCHRRYEQHPLRPRRQVRRLIPAAALRAPQPTHRASGPVHAGQGAFPMRPCTHAPMHPCTRASGVRLPVSPGAPWGPSNCGANRI
jgi:hypothetical protein